MIGSQAQAGLSYCKYNNTGALLLCSGKSVYYDVQLKAEIKKSRDKAKGRNPGVNRNRGEEEPFMIIFNPKVKVKFMLPSSCMSSSCNSIT